MSLFVRPMTHRDLNDIRILHDKYYSEFRFPPFESMLAGFIIEDETEEIILAGGVEAVAEVSLVTNKEKSRIKIGKALVEAQRIAMFTCKRAGIKDIYAFVKDEEYAEHLIRHGFIDCDRTLLLRVR